jgi:phosphopantetheinyl transferase
MTASPALDQLVPPAYGEAIVFACSLASPTVESLESYRAILSRDELQRADRFVLDPPRIRFVICRYYLRILLAAMTGESPGRLRFAYEPSGKPSLIGDHSLHFNVSHSQDNALIAVALRPIGIDIEIPDARLRLSSLIAQVLTSEERQATTGWRVEEVDQLLLKLWVCKEAILKALGVGIAGGMTSVGFHVPLDSKNEWLLPQRIDPALQLALDEGGTCAKNTWLDASSWRLKFLPAPAGGAAAVAVPRGITRVTFRQLEEVPIVPSSDS